MRLLTKQTCVIHAFPIFLAVLSASKYAGATFHPTEIGYYECVNTNSSRYDAINKSSPKCTKKWSGRNCRGTELDKRSESFLSVSGCKRCVHANGGGGFQCTTPDFCFPLAEMCDNDVHCGFGEDERNCEVWEALKCTMEYGDAGYLCNGTNGQHCIPLGSMCLPDNDLEAGNGLIPSNSTTSESTAESTSTPPPPPDQRPIFDEDATTTTTPAFPVETAAREAIGDFECVNVNTTRFEAINSSTNCLRLWMTSDCQPGTDITGTVSVEPVLSVSGCSKCFREGVGAPTAGFRCKRNGYDECLPYSFLCDEEDDCDGGVDEENCDDYFETCSYKGSQVEYKCEGSIDRRCVPFEYLCDGDKDCPEGDDERNCANSPTNVTTSSFEYSTTTTVTVLPSTTQFPTTTTTTRPGIPDRSYYACADLDDRVGFRCRTNEVDRCIPFRWLCDNDEDCDRGLDEKYCDRRCNFTGTWGNEPGFSCKDGESRCIRRSWVCDGVTDCLNGQDERNCTFGEKAYSIAMDELMFPEDQEATTPLGGPLPEFTQRLLEMNGSEVYEGNRSSGVRYVAYSRFSPNESVNAESVNFGREEKIVIYLPGYDTADLVDGLRVKDALFQGTEDVDWVVLVDWRNRSLSSDDDSWIIKYQIVASKNVQIAAESVRSFLVRKLKNENDVYLVGFGLGAHIAGSTAREAAASDNLIVDRITGLAGPLVEYSLFYFPHHTTNTLRATDAAFVDVIHTSSIVGEYNPAGHLNIFLSENECLRPSCRHHKAVELYIASLTRCSLLTCPSSGDCSPETMSEFGYLADKYGGRGEHELIVERNNLCSSFKTAYFPAKERICVEAPADAINTSECENKPYLSECPILCPKKQNELNSTSVCSWNSKVRFDSEGDYNNHPDSGAGAGSIMEWQYDADYSGCHTGCQNEEGHTVPYFVAYKPPKVAGYYVMYPEGELTKSLLNLSSPQSVFGRTFQPILEPGIDDEPTSYVIWHDDDVRDMREASSAPGDILRHSHGRSNGVLTFDRNGGGFLMIQSFPGFPLETEYQLSTSQDNYAQLAVCVSMYSNSKTERVAKLNTILDGFETFTPKVVMTGLGQGVDQSLRRKLTNLGKRRGLSTSRKPEISDVPLTSEFNAHFFARYRFGGKPNDAFVTLSRKYATSLKVQNGNDETRDPWPSSPCWSPLTVENVESMRVGKDAWNSTQDHSNWAVAGAGVGGEVASFSPLVCIGDLNRVPSSMARGGMFLCTRKQAIYDLFSQFPDALETCT